MNEGVYPEAFLRESLTGRNHTQHTETHTTRKERFIMRKTRKGFTLVELLIVIVVIGILSAMMMLSSTEAVTSAKASNIVSNFRNLKTAALAYYADNLDYFSKTPTAKISRDAPDGVLKYLGSTSSQIADIGNYYFENKAGEWYVSYDISQAGSATEQQGIKTKLAGRAGSVGLCKSMSSKDKFDATATSVAVFIR